MAYSTNTIASEALQSSAMPGEETRIVIGNVTPQIDCGRFPVKRIVGETVTVEADVFRDGHDQIAGAVRYRQRGAREWQEAPLTFVDNDRWRGSFALEEVGSYEFTVTAWTNTFG